MEARFAGQMTIIKTHVSNKHLLFESRMSLLTFRDRHTTFTFNAWFATVQAKQGLCELAEIFSGSAEAKNKVLSARPTFGSQRSLV